MRVPGFDMGPGDFRRSLKKSSFAPGALLLRPAQRRDLEIYYAFCRSVDDCADEYGAAQGRRFLRDWQLALGRKPAADSPLLVRELHRISRDYRIPLGLFRELVSGALSDLRPKVRFATARELELYCHRVAGVVGQACLPLFGLELKLGKAYAETLGQAFQLINILRDAKEDAARGRLYFALSDLRRFGAKEGKPMPLALLEHYASRARAALEKADALAGSLPRAGIRPSRMMRRLYGALLDRMEEDGLHVYEKRYSLGAMKKLWIVLTGLL